MNTSNGNINEDLPKQLSKGFTNSEDKKNKLLYSELLKMGFSSHLIKSCLKIEKIDNVNQAVDLMLKVDGKYRHKFVKNETDLYCEICDEPIENHVEHKSSSNSNNFIGPEDIKNKISRYQTSKLTRFGSDPCFDLVRIKSQQIPPHPLDIIEEEDGGIHNKTEKDVLRPGTLGNTKFQTKLTIVEEEKQTPHGEKTFHSIHISNRSNSIKNENDEKINEEIKEAATTFVCDICMGEISSENSKTNLDCPHKFCIYCLKGHVFEEIINSRVLKMKCPQAGCEIPISEERIKGIVDQELFEKYEKFLKNQKLQQDPNTKFCPIPDCDGYDRFDQNLSQQNLAKKLTCQKGHEFCSLCNKKWHEGRNCDEEIQNEIVDWIKQGKIKARQCQGCKAFIEKNKGCNHMTCTNCKHMFCWLCGQIYSDDHYAKRGPCYNKQFWDPDNPEQNQLYYGQAEFHQFQRRDPNVLYDNVIGNENIMRLELWGDNALYNMLYMFSLASHTLTRAKSFLRDCLYYFIFALLHIFGNFFVLIAIYKNTVFLRKYPHDSIFIVFLYYLTGMCIWFYSLLTFLGSSLIFLVFGIVNSAFINLTRDNPSEIIERIDNYNAAHAARINNDPFIPVLLFNIVNHEINNPPQQLAIEMNNIPNPPQINQNVLVQLNNALNENPNPIAELPQIHPQPINAQNEDHNRNMSLHNQEIINNGYPVPAAQQGGFGHELPNNNLDFNDISAIHAEGDSQQAKRISISGKKEEEKSQKDDNDFVPLFFKQNTDNLSHFTANPNAIINNNNIILSINNHPVENPSSDFVAISVKLEAPLKEPESERKALASSEMNVIEENKVQEMTSVKKTL